MAEGKNIEIRIAATGADQAAADIKKVGSAMGDTGLGATSKAAAKGLQDVAKEAPRVSAASMNMRGAIQNVAFQFQDMAVQAEMGVSATRIFSQQVPQLLGGFGAIGAVAGAVVGLGVPLAAALFNSGKAAEDAAPKVDALNKILEDSKEIAAELADQKRSDENKSFIESLSAEEEGYKKINSELQRQLALSARIRAQKEKTDEAIREAQIAEIEADPNKPESAKVAEVAKLREEGAAAKIEAEKAALENAKARAAAEQEAAAELAGRLADDAARAEAARSGAEARFKAFDSDANAAAEAGKSIPDLKKAIGNETYASGQLNQSGSFDAAAFDARQKRIKELEKKLEEAINLAKQAPALADARDAAKKDLEVYTPAAEKLAKDAKDAKAAADESFGKATLAADSQALESPLITARAEAERRQREARTAAQLRAAREREADAAARDQLTASQGALDAAAKPFGDDLRKRGAQSGDKTAESIGRALQDGTNTEELQKMANDVKAAMDANKTSYGSLLMEIISGLQTQAKDVETLKQQLRNKK